LDKRYAAFLTLYTAWQAAEHDRNKRAAVEAALDDQLFDLAVRIAKFTSYFPTTQIYSPANIPLTTSRRHPQRTQPTLTPDLATQARLGESPNTVIVKSEVFTLNNIDENKYSHRFFAKHHTP